MWAFKKQEDYHEMLNTWHSIPRSHRKGLGAILRILYPAATVKDVGAILHILYTAATVNDVGAILHILRVGKRLNCAIFYSHP